MSAGQQQLVPPATPQNNSPSPPPPLAPPLHGALSQQHSSHPPPLSPPRAVPFSTPPTPPTHMLDRTDIEVGGMTQELVHALHAELRRVRHGPLPDGTCDGVHTVQAMADREEALQRLQRQPQEVRMCV